MSICNEGDFLVIFWWFSGERWLIFAAVQETGAVIRRGCTGQSVDDSNGGWQTPPTLPPNPSCPTDLTSDVLHRAARQTLGHFSHAHILSVFPAHVFPRHMLLVTRANVPLSLSIHPLWRRLHVRLFSPLPLVLSPSVSISPVVRLMHFSCCCYPLRKLSLPRRGSAYYILSTSWDQLYWINSKAKKLILWRCTNTTWTSCVASRERDA